MFFVSRYCYILLLEFGFGHNLTPKARSYARFGLLPTYIHYFDHITSRCEISNISIHIDNFNMPFADMSKSFKHSTSSSTQGSRWKSMLNSVAKQVSQVASCYCSLFFLFNWLLLRIGNLMYNGLIGYDIGFRGN